MIAIKDCQWEVMITDNAPTCWWFANTEDKKAGIKQICARDYNKTITATKRNWEEAAKLNAITKWEYI